MILTWHSARHCGNVVVVFNYVVMLTRECLFVCVNTKKKKRELWRAVNWSCLGKAMNEESGVGLVIRAEMFGQLTTGLEAAWSKLRGQDFLTKDNIAEPMRDIRRALLEADVSLPVVRRFVQSVSDQAVGVGLIKGVSPDQQLVKVLLLSSLLFLTPRFQITISMLPLPDCPG